MGIWDGVDVIGRGHDGDGAVVWVNEVSGFAGERPLSSQVVEINLVAVGAKWPAIGKSIVVVGRGGNLGCFACSLGSFSGMMGGLSIVTSSVDR